LFNRIVVAAVAACLLGMPGIAAAQSQERFVVVDVGLSSKVLNELSSGGGSPATFLVRAAAELPVLGHTYMAKLDFSSYSYAHPANNVFPAGLIAGCPAGDAGCVTPVGYQSYNTVAPGIALYTPSFRANDTSTQIGFGPRIAKDQRIYLGVGYLWRTFNYGSVPAQAGFGIGIEKLPDFERMFSLYGNIWTYASMSGNFTGPTTPVAGAFSGRSFRVNYRMYTFRVGGTVAFPNSPLFADVSYGGDRLDANSSTAPSSIFHGALSLGVGAHF
jgi:hypothetical protein